MINKILENKEKIYSSLYNLDMNIFSLNLLNICYEVTEKGYNVYDEGKGFIITKKDGKVFLLPIIDDKREFILFCIDILKKYGKITYMPKWSENYISKIAITRSIVWLHQNHICKTDTILNLPGKKLRNDRNDVNHFTKKISFKTASISDYKNDCIQVYQKWNKNKSENVKVHFKDKDIHFIKNIDFYKEKLDISELCILIDGKAVGYVISGKLTQNSSFCFILKAEGERGINTKLWQLSLEQFNNLEFENDGSSVDKNLKKYKMKYTNNIGKSYYAILK